MKDGRGIEATIHQLLDCCLIPARCYELVDDSHRILAEERFLSPGAGLPSRLEPCLPGPAAPRYADQRADLGLTISENGARGITTIWGVSGCRSSGRSAAGHGRAEMR
jgi:hypothetical protein